MAAADDAARLVSAMNNSPTDRVRLGILAALDKSPPAALPHFVAQGGLAVLDRWVRSHEDLRLACLTSLQRIPMRGHDLEVARMCGAVLTVARQDAKPEVRQKAQSLLDKWANEGLVPQALGSTPAAGSRNSPADAQTLNASTSKRARVSEGGVHGLPENFAKLDPRIAKVLMERPAIMEFLSKHPSVMQNMNADSIAFLHRNLRNSKETLDEAMALEENEGCTVTLTNLAPRASELDVQELLERCGFGPAEVTMPRESRRQRTCGVAFAALPSRAAAYEAVRQLQGMLLQGKPLRLEIADGNAASTDPACRLDPRQQGSGGGAQGASRRIQWRHDEELWDVALFDRNESVASFSDRIQDSSSAGNVQLQPPPENNALFEAAATRERAEERRLVREALAAK